MDITGYTDERFIKYISAREKYAAIRELAAVFQLSDVCRETDELVEALIAREEIMTTGIGFEIAVPHARIRQVKRIAFAVGISRSGVDFEAIDKKPARLLIMVVAGDLQHTGYLRLLSKIMNLLKTEGVMNRLMEASTPGEILNIFKTPPADTDRHGLPA
ncbi:MAG: PTS sugar transporter subunit IIA [Desulfosudaceae bacterium]